MHLQTGFTSPSPTAFPLLFPPYCPSLELALNTLTQDSWGAHPMAEPEDYACIESDNELAMLLCASFSDEDIP